MAEFIEVVSGGGGSGTVTSVNNVQPVSGNVTLGFTDLNNKPTTILGYGITNAYTKDEIDAKTNVIYTSSVDEFNDSSKIQTNTNCVIDNGKIRPLFTSYQANGSNINNVHTSSDVEAAANGVVKVISGNVGYDATTNVYHTYKYTTQPFALQNTNNPAEMKVNVKANFTTPVGVSGFTSPERVVTINTSSTTEYLVAGFVDGFNGGNSYVTFDSGVTPHQLKFHYWDSATSEYKTSNLTYGGETISALSNDHIRNVVIAPYGNKIFIAYPSATTKYRIKKFDLQTRTEESTEVEISLTNATIAQKIDMCIVNNNLHIITAFGLSTSREARYFYKNNINTTWNANIDGQLQLVTTTSAALASFLFTVKFAPVLSENKIGWCAFGRGSSGLILANFGIINAATNSSFTTAVAQSGSFNCNGCGTILYDEPNNRFILTTTINTNNGVGFYRATNSSSATLTGINFINTAPFTAAGSNRDMEAYFIPGGTTTRYIDLILSNANRNEMNRVRVTSLATGNFAATGTSTNNLIFDSANTSAMGTIQVIPNQNSYDIVSRYESGLFLQQFKTNITPILRVRVLDEDEVQIPTTKTYTLQDDTFQEVSFGSQDQVALQFEFYYPVLKSTWDSASQPKSYSVELQDFMIEQTLPVFSNSTTRTFTSKTLISDRLIKKVSLFADLIQGNANNLISFEVSARGGAANTFVPISNYGTVDIPSNLQDTNLVLRATFQIDSSVSQISDLPSIDRYQVTVPNVVLTSDIVPLQINMMKLALQTNTLIQWNKTDFKNMFVDTFNYTDQNAFTANYTTTGNIQFNVSDKSVGSNSTSGVLESNTETADISAVSSILVLAESSITFGSMGVADNYISVSRNGGLDWYDNVPINEIFVFTGNETVKNQIRIKATMRFNVVYGWSYLYN